MKSIEAVEALEQMISNAKSVPLSASVVVPKDEALSLVQRLREGLPRETDEAREVLSEREQVIARAQAEAARILDEARGERAKLVSKQTVVKAAEQEAKKIVSDAETQAHKLRTQADDYVDAKLANFEIMLNKILRAVNRGREQLRRRLEEAQDELPPLSLEDSGEISGPIQVPPQQQR